MTRYKKVSLDTLSSHILHNNVTKFFGNKRYCCGLNSVYMFAIAILIIPTPFHILPG